MNPFAWAISAWKCEAKGYTERRLFCTVSTGFHSFPQVWAGFFRNNPCQHFLLLLVCAQIDREEKTSRVNSEMALQG